MKTTLYLLWAFILLFVALRYAVRLLNHAFGWQLFRGVPSLQRPPDRLEQGVGLAAIVFLLAKAIESAIGGLTG